MTGIETFRFAPDVTAPAAARRFVVGVLTRWDCAAAIDSAELMVSELVTNIVRHARSEGTLVLRRVGRAIRIETTDSGDGTPDVRRPTPREPSGRGLAIVDQLADRWGVEARAVGPGKTVWFELDLG